MHIIQAEIGAPKITVKQLGKNHALFVVAPLPQGYGMTLGNTFRRVLLSSLPGAAVTGVRIKGVSHEFTTISGATDSVLDMLLNLKLLRVKKHSSGSGVLKLEVNKTGVVTAADITKNADIEVLNPELVITTLDKKGSLSMEILVDKGVGYDPAGDRQKSNKEPGLILLDASYSPIERVRYDVSSTRVGDMTNLDKLELEILTNGSLTPEEAVKFASNVIKSYFELFNAENVAIEPEFIAEPAKIQSPRVAIETGSAVIDPGQPVGEASEEKYTPIEILGFSPRTLNALINGGIGSIEQLVKCNSDKIGSLRGFGQKALDEVHEKLAAKDLKLADD